MPSIFLFVLSVAIIGSAQSKCNLRNKWAESCRSPHMIPMTATMKRALVRIHNQKRNEIALGKIPHYSKAANMATMEWDDDLAAKATLNVRQCEMVHDKCAPGQNLAMSMTTGDAERSPQNIASMAGTEWFDKEQKLGGRHGWMNFISHFNPSDAELHDIGHFTQFVRSSANKLGCAASTSIMRSDGRDWNVTWLACNYSYGNMVDAPVYSAGSPASKCKTGNNRKYRGLCSRRERYNNEKDNNEKDNNEKDEDEEEDEDKDENDNSILNLSNLL